jgi:hypothetical protein
VATQVVEPADRGLVTAHHQRRREGEVRLRERDPLAPRLGHLEAVQDDVDVAALERGNQELPVVLHEVRSHSKTTRKGVGDIHLETDDTTGIVGILKDVRLPTLQIAAPAQHARCAHPGEAVATGRSRRLPSGRPPCQQGDQRDGGRHSQSLSV